MRVESGADAGLYDAINRGVALASGDVVGFLNADDVLTPGALAAVGRAFVAHPGAQMVSGGAEVFRTTASGTETLIHVNDDGAKALREQDVIHGSPILNARFFRRGLLDRVGPFDTRWRRSADFDFLMRVLEVNPERAVVDQVVYHSRAHADSLTFRGGVEVELTEEQLALCTPVWRRPVAPRHCIVDTAGGTAGRRPISPGDTCSAGAMAPRPAASRTASPSIPCCPSSSRSRSRSTSACARNTDDARRASRSSR